MRGVNIEADLHKVRFLAGHRSAELVLSSLFLAQISALQCCAYPVALSRDQIVSTLLVH